jgi:hypothetical protein
MVTLDPVSRRMFLDYVTRDFFAAVALLAWRARGDYGPDKRTEQFPRSEGTADPSLTAWMLAANSHNSQLFQRYRPQSDIGIGTETV